MDALLRLREPLALLAVAGLVLQTGLSFAAWLQAGSPPAPESASPEPLLILLAAAMAASCRIGPGSPRARAVVTAGLIGCLLAVLLPAAAAVAGGAGPDGWAASLTGLVPAAVGAMLLAGLLRGGARTAAASRVEGPAPAAAEPPAQPETTQTETTPAVAPEQRPTWDVPEATGFAWRRAGDAAGGAPAADWAARDREPGWTGWGGQGPSGGGSQSES